MNKALAANIIFLAAVVCTGCQSRFNMKEPFHIGTTKAPVIGMVFVPADFLALQPRLEELLDAPVLFDPSDPIGIASQLQSGRWQFAILSAGEYVSLKPEDTKGLTPLASGLFSDGKNTRKAFIVASASSAIKSLSDCKTRRFAFGKSGDLLLDYAARDALQRGGVSVKNLVTELPPVSVTGRLQLLGGGREIARIVAFDPTVNAGVIDQATFDAMPETGGNMITGPSRDLYRILGETQRVPGPIVLASPTAEAVATQKLQNFLVGRVKQEPEICRQMNLAGFDVVDERLYENARRLIPAG